FPYLSIYSRLYSVFISNWWFDTVSGEAMLYTPDLTLHPTVLLPDTAFCYDDRQIEFNATKPADALSDMQTIWRRNPACQSLVYNGKKSYFKAGDCAQGDDFTAPVLEPGTYTYYAYLQGRCLSHVYDSVKVTVRALPQITMPNELSVCMGEIVLTAESTGEGLTYQWSTGETTKTIKPYHVNEAVYSVVVTDKYGCESTASTHVRAGIFNGNHTAQIVGHEKIDTLCGDAPMTLQIASEHAGRTPIYRWYVNGAAVTGNNRPTFDMNLLPNEGRYNIYAQVTSSEDCVMPRDTVTQTVTVDRLPVPKVDAGPDMLIACGGAQILSGSWIRETTAPYEMSWTPASWLRDPWPISDITTPVITRPLFQTTAMTLNVTDANGCYGSDEMLIIVPCGELAVTCMQLPEETAICLGDYTVLQAMPQGGSGYYAYQWEILSGDSSSIMSGTDQLQIVVIPTKTTVYRFTLTDTETDKTVTCERTVQVDQPSIGGAATVQPAADFCADAELTFNLKDHRGNNIEWEVNPDAGNLDGWAYLDGYTGAPVKIPAEDTLYFRAFVVNGVCPGEYSEPVYVTPYAPIYNNSISVDVWQMCRDDNSGSNFEGLNVFGGMTDKYTYRWEYKNAKTANKWTALPTPNDERDYTLPTLTDDSTYVRRVANDSVCDRASNEIMLSFYPKAKAGILKPEKDTVCHAVANTLSLPETANFDIIQWEASYDGATWWQTATVSGYPGVVNSDTAGITVYYRAVVNHYDYCEADTSTVAKITFRKSFDLEVNLRALGEPCVKAPYVVVAETNHGDVKPTYKWFLNNVVVNGQTGDTLRLKTLAVGDVIRCVVACTDPCASKAADTAELKPSVIVPQSTITASKLMTCGTETVQLQASGTDVVAYRWLHSGETTANVNVVVSKKTTYTVETVNAQGCLDTASVEIKVDPELNISNDTLICKGYDPAPWAHLTFTSSAIDSSLWTNLSTGQQAKTVDWFVQPEATTKYALRIYSHRTDGTVCVAHDSVTVYVHDTVTPQITIHREGFAVGDTTVVTECGGIEARFIAEIKHGGPTPRYQWTINGREIKGATDSVFYTTDLFNFCYIRCRLTTSDTCPTEDEVWSNVIIVKLIEKNRVMIDINANTGENICADDTVTFYMSTAYEGTAPIYQWYLNDRAIPTEEGGKGRTWTRYPLRNGDRVRAVLFNPHDSTEYCPHGGALTNNPAYSNVLKMNVVPVVTPFAQIDFGKRGNSICDFEYID
ncbi:MAG: hypothetical protein K2I68_03320, partial [Bacteroidales bacterium]|nr:hypothetical protein [Bacteroidales bacterium]